MLRSFIYMFLLYLMIWLGFSAHADLDNFLLGAIVAAIVLWTSHIKRKLTICIRLFPLLYLMGFVAWELLVSSIEVACQILSRKTSRSAILTVPLNSTHPLQISLIATLVSLTPGSIAVKTDSNSDDLLVHVMIEKSSESVRHFIQQRLEPSIQKAFSDVSA